MKFNHFIAIYNDFSRGARIAWHYNVQGPYDMAVIMEFIEKLDQNAKLGDISTHKLSTFSSSFLSVREKDNFFEGVYVTTSLDRFIEFLNKGTSVKLSAIDCAKYIISLYPNKISPLKLQKLLYYVYAEFLIQTGERLFDEKIIAWKYGPVIVEVYQLFKEYRDIPLPDNEKERDKDDVFLDHSMDKNALLLQLFSSENGKSAIDVINLVVNEYINIPAGELVEKTHKKNGPWDRVYRPYENREIKDVIIEKYHKFSK